MAIDLDSGTGLFDRLGKIGHALNVLNAFVGGNSAGNLPTEVNDILAEYDGAANAVRRSIENLLEGLQSHQDASDSFRSILSAAAADTLIEMADADDPLASRDVPTALDELIQQMESASETVRRNFISDTITAAAGNDGNGVLIASIQDGRGRQFQNARQEDIVATVTSAVAAKAESWTVRGEEDRATNLLSHHYPSGSGADETITSRDPETDGALTNGGFNVFTTNLPNSWTASTGTPGTHFEEETTEVRSGAKSLQLNNNGSTVIDLRQDLSNAGLVSHTNYPIHVAAKRSGTISAGSLVIDLWDGSAVIQDESGNNNSLSITGSGIDNADFEVFTAVFRLPDPLPAQIFIRLRTSPAMTNATTVWVDELCLGSAMQSLYVGGPEIAIYAGDVRFGVDDSFNVAMGNDGAGDFQTLFYRLFQEPLKLLPSVASGETILDSLIG